jgi:hypothetical protein
LEEWKIGFAELENRNGKQIHSLPICPERAGAEGYYRKLKQKKHTPLPRLRN